MLAPAEIQQVCLRKYPDFLRSVVRGENFFPLQIRFGKPSTSTDFSKLRQEIEALASADLGYRIEWREVRSPRLGLGRQRLPERVTFEAEDRFLETIGKVREVTRFRAQLAAARAQCDGVVRWIERRPLATVEHASVWAELLQVCAHFQRHPRPGSYARELPLPIGTKFVAEHQGVLRELLDTVLPPDAIKSDAKDFEERFGLRAEEPLLRLRLLDLAARPPGWPIALDDFTIPHRVFVKLEWPPRRVLIVENKFTFLTLPVLSRSLAIWGAGHAVELVAGAPWLRACDLWYWGDLDVMGFHILNRLRQHFPQIRSVFMTHTTLVEHQALAIEQLPPPADETHRLTDDERIACAALRDRRLRLEQEKLPHAWVLAQLTEVMGDGHSARSE